MRTLSTLAFIAILAFVGPVSAGIQPWPENPFYWSVDGKPVLLLGGSSEDNLFLSAGARAELVLLASVGGNYVRNTMSSRDPGNERPFVRLPDGRYDLTVWNDEYWDTLAAFLTFAEELNIVVSIEIWDRFDHSREQWQEDPYNPVNNVNYSSRESGLATAYPLHPMENRQPFFKTVPSMQNNAVVLDVQQRFVRKLMSITLDHGNVLYTMDNETSGAAAWSRYWAELVRAEAEQAGKTIYVTEMWDEWDVTARIHRRTLAHPETYDFADLSQNTHMSDETHWDRIQAVRRYLLYRGRPWPLNAVKIYGADGSPHGDDSEQAVEKFWRQIIGGMAASRFHRPPGGLGLNELAQRSIQAARLLENEVQLWKMPPRQYLLSHREEDEAYVAAEPGEQYAVYFTDGGSVEVRLDADVSAYRLDWLDIENGEWGESTTIAGGTRTIAPPGNGPWVAVIVKRSSRVRELQ